MNKLMFSVTLTRTASTFADGDPDLAVTGQSIDLVDDHAGDVV